MRTETGDPRPQRADARRNREAILDAAQSCFGECGPAAQIDDIARTASVGVGTVYRHFPTKDALVGALLRRKFLHLTERVRRWNEVEDPWEAFEGYLRETAEEMQHDRTQQTLMWIATEGAVAQAADVKAELLVAARELIERGRAAGVLREDLGTDDMPTIMCAIGSVMSANNLAVSDWRRLLDLLIDGIRAR